LRCSVHPGTFTFASALRIALASALIVAAAQASGQNAANGKKLYGFYCQVCHSPDPSTAIAPFNLIMSAANNPAQITYAASVDPADMSYVIGSLAPSDLSDLAAYIGTFLAAPATTPVVEYYDAAQDHYFITAAAAEIADLDNGVHSGWSRTGYSFQAYLSPAAGTNPVCRFYIPPAQGDSHFYSASPTECAQVQASFPTFVLESSSVFYIAVPDSVTGACPSGTVPVYRVWDDRADTNHRYTTSLQVRQQMQSAGWIAEGYGPQQVIMCAPM